MLCFCRDFSQRSAHVSGRNCSEESPGLPRTRAQHLHLYRSVYRSDSGTPWALGQGGSLPFYFITLDCLSLLWTSQINIYFLNFCCCKHVLNRSVTASDLLIIIIWLFHTGRALASVPLSSCGAYIHTTHVVAMVPRESEISVDGKAEHSCHYHR